MLRTWGVLEPRSEDKVPTILCSIRHDMQDLLQGPAMVLTGKSELDIESRKGSQRKQRPPPLSPRKIREQSARMAGRLSEKSLILKCQAGMVSGRGLDRRVRVDEFRVV